MKNELGVSSVVGVVLLLLLVIVASSIMAVVLSTATNEAVDSTPNALFTISNNNQTLYHGGGDVLYKDRLVFYSNGLDITSDIKIDSEKSWATWHTGQAIQLPANHYVANLIIIALDSLGREQLLFKGSDVVSIPLPTYTGPIPAPTPTPNAAFTWEVVKDGAKVPKTGLPSLFNADGYIVTTGSQPEVKFTAVENGIGVIYNWLCPGAVIDNSNIRSPKMRFSESGSYSVTLTVTNGSVSNSSTQTFSTRKLGVTAMTWVLSTNKNNKGIFASSKSGSNDRWNLNVADLLYGYTMKMYAGPLLLASSIPSYQTIPEANTWYHVTGTYENTFGEHLIIYFNGGNKIRKITKYGEFSGIFGETIWGSPPEFTCDSSYEIPFALTSTEIKSVYDAEKSAHGW